MDRPTSVSRTAGITVKAKIREFDHADSFLWNIGGQVTVTAFGSTVEVDPTYVDPTHLTSRARPRVDITVVYSAGHPSQSCNVTMTDSWVGSWTITSSADPDGASGHITADAQLDASYALDEYAHDLDDGTYFLYERINTLTLNSSASFTAPSQYQSGWYNSGAAESFTLSSSGTNSATLLGSSMFDSKLTNYVAAVHLSARSSGGINIDSSISCSGISYSGSASYTSAHGALSGNGVGASLTGGGSTTTAQATITAEPDWSLSATVYNVLYRDNSPLAGVAVELLNNPTSGSPVVVATSTAGADGIATVSYTATPYLSWTYNDGYGLGDSVSSGTSGKTLFNYSGVNGTDFWQVGINRSWADAYGTQLTSTIYNGNGRIVLLDALPGFSAGTISIDRQHQFRMFNSLTGWGSHSNLSMTGGLFTLVVNDALYGLGSGNLTWLDGGNWKPFGYRYYKFRVKSSVAGSTFKFTLTRQTGGPGVIATYSWNFTIGAADTWQDLEFDLLHPHEFSDGALTLLGIHGRYPLHPSVVGQAGFTSMSYQFPTQATYTVDGLYGFHKANTVGMQDRIPVLAHAGFNANFSSNNGASTLDIPSATSNDSTLPPTGPWGEFIVNGGLSFGVWSGFSDIYSNIVQTQQLYDTNTIPPTFLLAGNKPNDTGIHVTVVNSGHTVSTLAAHGYQYSNVLMNMDGATDTLSINCQRRAAACYGYYGMGGSSTLSYSAHRVWGGEVDLYAWKNAGPITSGTISVQAEDTTALTTATPNLDGFARITSLKYGAPYPYSNLPAAGGWSARAQYTSDPTNHSAITAYTTQGLKEAGYRLQWSRFKFKDGSGYLIYSPNFSTASSYPVGTMERVAVMDKAVTWFDLESSSGGGPQQLETRYGQLMVTYEANSRITFKRSATSTPPFEYTNADVTGSASDTNPQIIYDFGGRVRLLFTRNGSVYEIVSADLGETWSTPQLMFSNADFGYGAGGYHGEIIRAAYANGNIVGTTAYPGDSGSLTQYTWKDGSGNPLQVEPTTFSFGQAQDGTGRYTASLSIKNENAVSHWWSGDQCETWARIT